MSPNINLCHYEAILFDGLGRFDSINNLSGRSGWIIGISINQKNRYTPTTGIALNSEKSVILKE